MVRSIYRAINESQDSPGHGYPAGIKNFIEYIPLANEEDLIKWIYDNRQEKFKVFKVKPLKVETEIKISVK